LKLDPDLDPEPEKA